MAFRIAPVLLAALLAVPITATASEPPADETPVLLTTTKSDRGL
ncbi:hypothetical protein [Jannaschia aquimarina]|uniref:Uncharacterized protein n=1 Tax=Jannaschia aquimarina TaxID=935700 RepID=A0A0D1DCL1_9RHOB|nr:hypothetical protein [Jannaschia aquimarina]KIT17718.1 hypothetical protein jaqu_06090 [Jannaschia aquimarina]SNS78245.1 hypothetical protein SAMN05421775_102272 [Jannaschia aquimarina]